MNKNVSVRLAEPGTEMKRSNDGSIILTNPTPLPRTVRCITQWLVDWAGSVPDRVFLAERDGDGWRKLTYLEVLHHVKEIASWLVAHEGSQRPVVVLSDNSIDHGLLSLACQHVGIPVTTISVAYSLASTDHTKLKAMIGLVDPQVIYVADIDLFATALTAIEGLHTATIMANSSNAQISALPFAMARGGVSDAAVQKAFEAITPDTTAKYLFTSGSTGVPKAVINTHTMLTSNQEGRRINWEFLQDEPPVICDWLPWSHTFGANHNFNMALRNGGSLYIDDGKPAPHLIQKTVTNIKAIKPSIIFNVPRGYDMLLAPLKDDADFRKAFFSAKLLCYAGAALPQSVWSELSILSKETVGYEVLKVSSWGSTETAPMATDCHFAANKSGNIGIAGPGTTIKLVPNAGKYEIRVKGPNVTPGYLNQPDLTDRAFDEEGFYIIGDAVRFADDYNPAAGLYFDGRVTEDFKLASGTWVSAGELRIAGIEMLHPLAQDIVIAGHGRNDIGFLIFPNFEACRALAQAGKNVPNEQLVAHPDVRAQFSAGLARLKSRAKGSSRHAARARLLPDMPNVDGGEITDKGYINQRQVLENRAADVAALFGEDGSAFVMPRD